MLLTEEGNTFTGGIDGKSTNTSYTCVHTGKPDNDPESTSDGRCDCKDIDTVFTRNPHP